VLLYLAGVMAGVLPRSKEQGQGLVEYGLILVLIAIVAIVAVTFIGNNLSSTLSMVGKSV
jgi:pilus assembly protein Flp/PilA